MKGQVLDGVRKTTGGLNAMYNGLANLHKVINDSSGHLSKVHVNVKRKYNGLLSEFEDVLNALAGHSEELAKNIEETPEMKPVRDEVKEPSKQELASDEKEKIREKILSLTDKVKNLENTEDKEAVFKEIQEFYEKTYKEYEDVKDDEILNLLKELNKATKEKTEEQERFTKTKRREEWDEIKGEIIRVIMMRIKEEERTSDRVDEIIDYYKSQYPNYAQEIENARKNVFYNQTKTKEK
jgi:hypothetical protein